MQNAAKDKGIEANINAIAESDLKNSTEGVDVLLLGPQVRYMLSKVRTLMEPKGVPVDVINSVDYGTMNGTKVLDQAISLISGK
jgi:PTS system cellobiose-specific IIB component